MPSGDGKKKGGAPVIVRVMIVDDTDHVRDMLAQMLVLDGFEIAGTASSGPEAIELAPLFSPDVVVMDYKMPGMNGISATKGIRERLPDLPVILYTAYLDRELEDQARTAGVSVCVGKIEGLASLEREISALCLELVEG
jgi:CheY-like chemotaxis protein